MDGRVEIAGLPDPPAAPETQEASDPTVAANDTPAPQPAPAAGAVDLLKLIDPARDAVAGEWRMDGNALVIPAMARARLEIPQNVPDEYTLTIDLERTVHDNALYVGLPSGNAQTMLMIDGGGGKSGLQNVDGKEIRENGTLYDQRVITDGSPRTLVCTVRRTGIHVTANGNTIVDWKGDRQQLSVHPSWRRRDSQGLFLGSWDTEFRVTKLELSPLGSAPADSGSRPAPPVATNYTSGNADRQAAEWVRSIGGSMTLRIDSRTVSIGGSGAPLPDEDFAVVNLNIGGKGPQVTDADLRRIRELRALESLMVWDTEITDAGLEHLTALPQLQSLHLQGTGLTAAGLTKLKELRRLSSLSLGGDEVRDDWLTILKDLTELNTLVLQTAPLSDAGLAHLKDVRNLRMLRLSGLENVTPAGFAHLADCSNLQNLSIFSRTLDAACFESLAKLRQLPYLLIDNCAITDAGLQQLRDMPRLTSLTLNNRSATEITGAGLENLKTLPSLNNLHLNSARQLTDADLVHLKDLNLFSLSLSQSQVTGDGLQNLKGMTRLTTLNLSMSAVSDSGLTHLKGLGLSSLQLFATQITDDGLEHLKELTNLRSLNLTGSKVTQAGVDALKAALPDCNINFSPGAPNR